jgi:hypothetical protein
MMPTSSPTFFSSASRDAQALLFGVQLRAGLSRNARQRFFKRMSRQLQRAHLVVTHSRGWCVVLPLVPGDLNKAGHLVFKWLLSQAEVKSFHAIRPQAVQELILNPLQWDRDGHARKEGLIRSEDTPQRLSKLVMHCMLRLVARQSERWTQTSWQLFEFQKRARQEGLHDLEELETGARADGRQPALTQAPAVLMFEVRLRPAFNQSQRRSLWRAIVRHHIRQGVAMLHWRGLYLVFVPPGQCVQTYEQLVLAWLLDTRCVRRVVRYGALTVPELIDDLSSNVSSMAWVVSGPAASVERIATFARTRQLLVCLLLQAWRLGMPTYEWIVQLLGLQPGKSKELAA